MFWGSGWRSWIKSHNNAIFCFNFPYIWVLIVHIIIKRYRSTVLYPHSQNMDFETKSIVVLKLNVFNLLMYFEWHPLERRHTRFGGLYVFNITCQITGRLLKKMKTTQIVWNGKTERPHIMIAGNSTVNKDQQSANQQKYKWLHSTLHWWKLSACPWALT